LLVHASKSAVAAVGLVAAAVAAAVAAGIVVVLFDRWRGATPAARRVLAPVLWAAAILAVTQGVYDFDPSGNHFSPLAVVAGIALVAALATTTPTLRARPKGTTTRLPRGISAPSGAMKSKASSSGTSSATRAIFTAGKGVPNPVDNSVNSSGAPSWRRHNSRANPLAGAVHNDLSYCSTDESRI